ncbi:MAG: helix-hairpin-helix domain-containing protein, partial [Aggregatilineales bacterium]
TDAPTATPEPILVYITGAVSEPEQTLTVAHDSRVSDVIDAAGGLTDDADTERVNLAGIVRDGDQIHVPSLVDISDNADADNDTALPTPSGGGIVFINSATLEELQTLPGIGPATATDIIAYRDENGDFTSLEDLDDVPGIGPSTLEALTDLVSFE